MPKIFSNIYRGILIAHLLIIGVVINGCKKTETTPDSTPSNLIVSLELSSDKASMVANSQDTVVFIVKALDASKKQVSVTNVEFYINGNKTSSAIFTTSTPGSYIIYAKHNNISSNNVVINALSVEDARKIQLKSNSHLLIADGKSSATLNSLFIDEFGKQRNLGDNEWKLFANGVEVSGKTFKTTNPGIYKLHAEGLGITSEPVEIEVRENKNYPIVTIPIVFHIGHYGEEVNQGLNISASRVHEVLEYLNRAFSGQTDANNPNTVDMRVRFRLATIDPDGNTMQEPGILRYNISKYDNGYSASVDDKAGDKAMGSNERGYLTLDTSWDPDQYLNIWVTPTETAAGWARLPVVYASHPLPGLNSVSDGCTDCIQTWVPFIFVHTNYFQGTTATIIHEVGHSLGLFHVFSENNCQTSDFCPDTFSYNSSNASPCYDNRGSLIRDNFMDYNATGVSRQAFTYDQRERVQHVLKYGHWVSKLPFSNK